MCTCTAEIKESYTKVRLQTAEVAQQKFDIDDYLDMVIVVRKKLEQITDETNNLVETVKMCIMNMERDHLEFGKPKNNEINIYSKMASAIILYVSKAVGVIDWNK